MTNSDLKEICQRVRLSILESCFRSGGHISTSLSCVEILVELYFGDENRLKYDDIKLRSCDRDVFVMSKGHGENALYSVLIEKGFVAERDLKDNYRGGDFVLGGHVDSSVPGVEVSTGALGHGCSVAAGIALAKKKRGCNGVTYCLLGDAECSEGSVWESIIFAVNNRLDNLVFIIDDNKIGSLDFTSNYIDFDRYEAVKGFGANVLRVDGHCLDDLHSALALPRSAFTVIVADTTKGKGIASVENDPIWHVKKVDEPTYNNGILELRK